MQPKEFEPFFAVLTTLHRGVFFGKVLEHDPEWKWCRLESVRMAVHWSADVRGVVGLAVTGPSKGCRITRAAPGCILRDITAVMSTTAGAVKAWEGEPWPK